MAEAVGGKQALTYVPRTTTQNSILFYLFDGIDYWHLVSPGFDRFFVPAIVGLF